jgi:hypothetical protein
MNRAKAWKLLRKRWGDDARLRHNPEALSAEQRAAKSEELKQHRMRKPQNRKDYAEWKKKEQELFLAAITHPYNAGYYNGFAFCIQGSGDTIEEATTKALSR